MSAHLLHARFENYASPSRLPNESRSTSPHIFKLKFTPSLHSVRLSVVCFKRLPIAPLHLVSCTTAFALRPSPPLPVFAHLLDHRRLTTFSVTKPIAHPHLPAFAVCSLSSGATGFVLFIDSLTRFPADVYDSAHALMKCPPPPPRSFQCYGYGILCIVIVI